MGLHIAILAAAARGHRKRHGNSRPRRRLRAIRPNHREELRYKYELLQLVKHCRRLVDAELHRIESLWPRPTGDSTATRLGVDSIHSAAAELLRKVKGKLGGLDEYAKRMAGLAAEANRDTVDKRLAAEIHRAIGVDVSRLLQVNGPLLRSMKAATDANVALIKSIPDQYLDRVYSTVTDGWTNGLRWESLVEQIQRDGDITDGRAKLIARDQTAKMNSAFNQERQQQVGIEKYEWSTSADERVRDSHADMDGKTCDWDSPPTVDGEPVHPGEAINCRCVAIPVVDMEELAIGGMAEEPEESEAA